MQPGTPLPRLRSMRTQMATTAGLLVLLALAGCGGQSAVGETTAPSGSVVVTNDFRPGEDGKMYVEGAEIEVVLRDAAGHEVATKTGDRRIRFDGLAPGEYTLEPALRPCDGSCDQLDPRTDECSGTDQVGHDTLGVRVEYHVGEPCRIHNQG